MLLQLDDEITCQKKRVESTLDRLAQRVALEKKERAEKCRAFKVRQLRYQILFISHLQYLHKAVLKKPTSPSAQWYIYIF